MPTVAFDAVANLGTANTTAGLSHTFTLGGSATALCVAVGGWIASTGYSALTTRTVKVGTTPLRLLGVINGSNTPGYGWIELWGMISPPTGTQTITVVENASTTAALLNVTAISYTGCAQFGIGVTHAGSAAAVTSGAIVSATGNRVLSVQGTDTGTMALTGGGTLRSKQPTSASDGLMTLLLQDSAGAATVTQTSTYTGGDLGDLGWASVSVNLIAGNVYTVGATASLTVARNAAASFVGQVWHVGAHLSLSTSQSTGGFRQAQGPPLRYVGRAPDSPSVLGTASYALADDVANLVTPTYITQQVTQAAKNLVTQSWVTEQAGGRLTQASVTSALGSYIINAQLGANSGVAQANGSGSVPSAQLPALTTNNVAKVYDCVGNGTVFLPTGNIHTVTSENIGEFVLANVVIPNPGYPWIALPFGYVLGYSSGASSGSRLLGNGNIGFLAVTQPEQSTPIYGMALMTGDTRPSFYPVVPGTNGLAQINPGTQRPFQTGVTLQLSACNYTGSTYTVSGTGLVFYVLVLPALGGS